MTEKEKVMPSRELDRIDWKDIADQLHINLQKGLERQEVEKRIRQFSYNEIPEKKGNPLLRFAKKFWGITPWMLELTMLLSFVLGKYLDLYIIGGLLLLNSVLGFAQEEKA